MHGTDDAAKPTLGGDSEAVSYRVQSAARLLDLSERIVWELVRTGQIDSFKVGAARLIPRAALFAFMEKLKRERAA